MRRILLVDDSKVLCSYVSAMLSRVPDTQVLRPVHDGLEAVRVALEQRPDVVLMDIQLPGQSGLDAIRQILAVRHMPIVVLSSYVDDPSRNLVFEALAAGAVDVLAKPRGMDAVAYESFRDRLLQAVDVAQEARAPTAAATPAAAPAPALERSTRGVRLVAVGASTGGPAALAQLLCQLPSPFPAPVVVAQHILEGFDRSLARWLASASGHDAALVEDGMVPAPGQVLVAPAQRDVEWVGGRLRVATASGRWRPSVDRLFHSVARGLGEEAIGIVLTGLGADGAAGLAALRAAGARTYAQSAESCVVDGMPGSARQAGAVEQSAAPDRIGRMVRALAGVPA